MSEKVEFKEDVGQAVVGDVIEAPRLSNVVNLSLTEAKKEVQRITDYQRKRINLLVKEWAAICGDKEIEIYKLFIADFGLRYFRELPMEHYLSVKDTLEGWIAGASKATTEPPAVEQAAPIARELTLCPACPQKDATIFLSRRTNFTQWVLIALLVALCSWLFYKVPTPHDGDQLQGKSQCYFNGKAYSPGGTVRDVTGNWQECVVEDAATQAHWQTMRRGR